MNKWFVYDGYDGNGRILNGFAYTSDIYIEGGESHAGYTEVTDPILLAKLRGKHYIQTIADPTVLEEDHRSINYETELRTGISLDKYFILNNDGTLHEFYRDDDRDGVVNKCIHIDYIYEYNPDDLAMGLAPSLVQVIKKTKVWCYYLEDGVTLDNSDDLAGRTGTQRVTSKEKVKYYHTTQERLEMGSKRRKNLEVIASEKMATAFVLLGVLPSQADGIGKAKEIASFYSNDLTEYRDHANDSVFNSITNDAQFPELDTIFPDQATIDAMPEPQKSQLNGAIALYGLEDMRGKSIKTYVVEKLKGEVK